MKLVTLPTGNKLTAETASTPQERQAGLMNRQQLSQSHGMLLQYSEAAERSIWMKNTYIPLDIVFLTEHKQVLNVEQGEPLNEEHIWSDGDAQYILEVNQGEAQNLERGDTLHF